MSDPVLLRDWSTTALPNDGYTPPECRVLVLQGAVYGHPDPKFTDGDRIVTSAVKDAKGLEVWTRHTHYKLEGPPDPKFVEFCQVNNIPFDPENPIRIIK